MKKTFGMILGTVIIMALCFSSYAGDTQNHVYAEPVTVEAGEDVQIPIQIENNAGLMGFALYISYNESVLTPLSVSKGSMLSGMFNDSIATQEQGQFKIVFSATEDCKSDGILCTITFHTKENASGKEQVQISYSPDDTFNEQWKAVELHCDDVQLVITQNGTTAPDVSETEPETEMTEPQTEEPSSEQPLESSTEVEPQPGSVKDSKRLRTWFKSLPTVFRVLLAGLIYPAIWILSVFGH